MILIVEAGPSRSVPLVLVLLPVQVIAIAAAIVASKVVVVVAIVVSKVVVVVAIVVSIVKVAVVTAVLALTDPSRFLRASSGRSSH